MATTAITFTIPGPCGCCGPVCCLCLSYNVCVDFTNPDWASWGCNPSFSIFTAPGEIKMTVPNSGFDASCDGGVRGEGYRYGVAGTNSWIAISLHCNDDGTCQLQVDLGVLCVAGSGNFRVFYNTTTTISLITDSGVTCQTIVPATVTVPATRIDFGTPPVPLGSLSPCTLTITNGSCPAFAPLPRSQTTTEQISIPVPTPARTSLCTLLGERTEFRAGCGGWMCKHKCTSTDPAVVDHLGGIMEAVPGDDCQDCPGYQQV